MWVEIMQKLRNKIQEKKAELKLDNAELGLAIGRGERYIDRLLRDAVSTAKQEEVIEVLDGLSFAALAKKYRDSVYISQHNHDCANNYLNQLHTSTNELSNLKDQYKAKNIQVEGLLKDADELEKMHNDERNKLIARAENAAEQIDRSAKQLAASVVQNENLKEQIENMAMQLTNVELDNKELQGDLDGAKFNLNAEKTSNLRECGIMKIKHSRELAAKNKQLNFARFICALLTLVLFLVIALASIQW